MRCKDCEKRPCEECGICGCEDSLWISVKERFPTQDEQAFPNRIIVYFETSEMMGIQPEGFPIGPSDPYPYYGPSHWMQAPSPPVNKGG